MPQWALGNELYHQLVWVLKCFWLTHDNWLGLNEFPGGLAGKESACNAGDLGSIPGLGKSPGEDNGYTLQYSGLENSMTV